MVYLRKKLGQVREMIRQRDLFRGDPSELRKIAVYEANRLAGQRYVPGPYRGPAIVALTDGRVPPGTRNYRLDWVDLVPQCASPCLVPGRDTGEMLIPPNVYALARHVNSWVEEAHARVGFPTHRARPDPIDRAGCST